MTEILAAAEYKGYLEAVSELLKTKKNVIVAIDGACGSGKSTLGAYLKKELGGNLFHMDDFYLLPSMRTEERLSEVGGNVHYERFYSDVLEKLISRQEVLYRPYSCSQQKLLEGETYPFERLTVIEGSYSFHPYFTRMAGRDPYDLKIFLKVDYEEQLRRIGDRSGEEKLKRFISEWIPKENAYFEMIGVSQPGII